VQGPREHTYLQGIADKHVNLSPGNSLELHAIREAIGEGRNEFELGPGRDEYKYRLGARDREFTRLVVASPSSRGRLVGASAAIDLRLRNTAAAEALRGRLGITSERATAGSSGRPTPLDKPSTPR
jgi:CelD/BcsL family acetyltransferase involved in cellulose biosynthesis